MESTWGLARLLLPSLMKIALQMSAAAGALEYMLEPEPSHNKQIQAVRIVQEALANVRRHAQARSVQVKLSGDTEAIRIIIRDDGAGFDVCAIGADNRHLGTTLMHERAQRSDWFLTSHSLPGRGTEVTFHYPEH